MVQVAPVTLSTADVLPVIDLSTYLAKGGSSGDGNAGEEHRLLCLQVADMLKSTGCLVVRDPRVDHSENDRFLDMMEDYFSRSAGEKDRDSRPQLSFQVGYTPEGTEVPRAVKDQELQKKIASMSQEHRAIPPAGADAKCRYMWPLRERRSNMYKGLNPNHVVPEGIPGWNAQMNGWGEKMLKTVETVSEMAALGFGLPADAFTSRMLNGPHILAPTGSDLKKNSKLGTVYAGYHYDLNFLTIHGKSRFPGLCVWLRDGRRAAVSIPDGCLLLQAGRQLEWLTGGEVMAGMHEVGCTSATQAAIYKSQSAGRSLWRVSSTVFSHIASDVELAPLGPFLTPASKAKYPRTDAGAQVQQELEAIRLSADGKQE